MTQDIRTLARISALCFVSFCLWSFRLSGSFNGQHIYFRIPRVLAQVVYDHQRCPTGMSVIITEGAWQYFGSRGFVQFGCADQVGNFWINGTVYVPMTRNLNSALVQAEHDLPASGGNIILANGTYQITSPLQPSNNIRIQGQYGRGGTIIQAQKGFPTRGPLHGGHALIEDLSSTQYQQTSNVMLDCNNIQNAIGFYETDLQEQSGLTDDDVVKCPNYGIWMNNSGHSGQNWSIVGTTVESPSLFATDRYTPLYIDGNDFKAIRDVTLIGASTFSKNCGFITSTVMGDISGLHMEQCMSGLVLDNFQGGTIHSIECSTTVATNCLTISSTKWSIADVIEGVLMLTHHANAIDDVQDSRTIVTGAFGGGVGFYSLSQDTPPFVVSTDTASQFAFGLLTRVFAVANLPTASSLAPGTQFVVRDSKSLTPGPCTGGGTNYMIAITNGSDWSCH